MALEGPGVELALSLEGMWCTACSWVIEAMLRKLPGVLEVSVSFASDAAWVRYLPHRVSSEELLRRVAELGYRAGPLAESTAETEAGRRLLLCLGFAAIFSAHAMMISWALYWGLFEDLGPEAIRAFSWVLLFLTAPVVFGAGAPIFRRAWSGFLAGTATMDTLVAAGTLSAFAYSLVAFQRGSVHLYFDTASMLVTIVLFGRYAELLARRRVTRGIGELHRLARAKVRIVSGGQERWVASDAAEVGTELLVRAGETIPVDGRVLFGSALLDESAISGESRPVERGEGQEVRAGARLLSPELPLQATRVGQESSLAQIVRTVDRALARKGGVELLADRWTRRLVPAVLSLALLTTAVLLLGDVPADEALLRGVAVLVITCPCALGIAAPLAKVAAIARAREEGVLVRNPGALEQFGQVDLLVYRSPFRANSTARRSFANGWGSPSSSRAGAGRRGRSWLWGTSSTSTRGRCFWSSRAVESKPDSSRATRRRRRRASHENWESSTGEVRPRRTRSTSSGNCRGAAAGAA
ncbi:MAG: cation-translocating P-type ATPase [Deltaproteobacteria bacterium]|nr:cation-translocating P-type ATPase [Deltaproteobacteria bacterium]